MVCRLAIVCGMAFEAKIAHGPGIQAIYGLDAVKREADVARAVAQGAAGLLSFGVAAGLSPKLFPGAIIVGQRVISNEQVWESDGAWRMRVADALPEAIAGDIAGIDQPVTSVSEKAALHAASSAAIADMESHHVAALAARYQLPFAVLRIVLDDATCSLPPAALVATKQDGTIDYLRLIGALLAKPGQLGEMMRLGSYQAAAKKSLLRCRELLDGSRFGMDVG